MQQWPHVCLGYNHTSHEWQEMECRVDFLDAIVGLMVLFALVYMCEFVLYLFMHACYVIFAFLTESKREGVEKDYVLCIPENQ